MIKLRFLGLAAVAVAAVGVGGTARTGKIACFDAEVTATIVRQTPTVGGLCGDGCIVVSWPWVVELRVRRVHSGRLDPGPLTVLNLQHAAYRRDIGARRWWLRENALGGFNVLQIDGPPLPQCPRGETPEAPFVVPAEGQTLEDLRREGEAYYGRGDH
ncbi:hypothetical protein [Phenylobacterium sp.]|uniref:hypothetical protein n=1 Tax=Phenylobacterium sp. TaxID=1871053 RepID=UPI00273141CF|nr:hypothetical protein [Phenylobacterium sp.]MDP1616740.1 hypothetical protein [Phenylobacterium sp.]MDP1987634.1 hypothetical protein [Phenylobacterium sp.]